MRSLLPALLLLPRMVLAAASASAPVDPTRAAAPVVAETQVRLGLVTLDAEKRTISLPVRVNMTNGTLEYALVADYGKTHESLFVTDASAVHLHSALLLLHAQPAGTNAVAPEGLLSVPPRSAVSIEVRWDTAPSRPTQPLESLVVLVDPRTHAPTGRLARAPWLFSGSYTTREGYGAHFDGSYIALIRDPVAILNNPRPGAADDEIHAPAAALPALGTPATLVLTPAPAVPGVEPAAGPAPGP